MDFHLLQYTENKSEQIFHKITSHGSIINASLDKLRNDNQQTDDCRLITQLSPLVQNYMGFLPNYKWSYCKNTDVPTDSYFFHQLENTGSR